VSLNPLNQNPQIQEVRFGQAGATQVIGPNDAPTVPTCTDQQHHNGCTAWQFEVAFQDGSRETYRTPDPLSSAILTQNERMTVAYLVSAGTLDGGFRSDSPDAPMSNMANTFYAPDRPQRIDLWVYGNDGRGGFDFAVRHLTVQ
jgi:hypothetical protein